MEKTGDFSSPMPPGQRATTPSVRLLRCLRLPLKRTNDVILKWWTYKSHELATYQLNLLNFPCLKLHGVTCCYTYSLVGKRFMFPVVCYSRMLSDIDDVIAKLNEFFCLLYISRLNLFIQWVKIHSRVTHWWIEWVIRLSFILSSIQLRKTRSFSDSIQLLFHWKMI